MGVLPQPVKPTHSMGIIGTTEVVPCYKARDVGVCLQAEKPRSEERGFDFEDREAGYLTVKARVAEWVVATTPLDDCAETLTV